MNIKIANLALKLKISFKRFLNNTFLRTEIRLSKIEGLLSISQIQSRILNHKNPLNRYGNKCFSQNEEDGITLEIIRRLGLNSGGTFAEFGVDDGTENNTLILRSLGWKGFWVGKGDLHPSLKTESNRFVHIDSWIDLKNVSELAKRGQKRIGSSGVDLISLDLDGNDFYFIEALLADSILPKVFIVEYNSKFIPPVEWEIEYNATHEWLRDDYFGASLTTLVKLFAKFQYALVCCNITGSNAFFIRNEFVNLFPEVPEDITDIYCPPLYDLKWPAGYPLSRLTLSRITCSGSDT